GSAPPMARKASLALTAAVAEIYWRDGRAAVRPWRRGGGRRIDMAWMMGLNRRAASRPAPSCRDRHGPRVYRTPAEPGH
ncbi:MAG TPA: hypothetical protein VFQ88_00645, partial [Nevskiaceae bacterium]|nr:hypothetical protein [Nevskiaceae bacterium]